MTDRKIPEVPRSQWPVSERTAFLIFAILMFMLVNIFTVALFILDDVVEIHDQLETSTEEAR